MRYESIRQWSRDRRAQCNYVNIVSVVETIYIYSYTIPEKSGDKAENERREQLLVGHRSSHPNRSRYRRAPGYRDLEQRYNINRCHALWPGVALLLSSSRPVGTAGGLPPVFTA